MIPYLNSQLGCLMVEQKPYFIFGGELHNSSCSSITYLKEVVIPRIREIPINTLLLPVYWENIEKVEGIYDFSLVREIIDLMRDNNLKIIILWFGLWKNGLSTYVPSWMKLDRNKYPFCQNKAGKSLYTISPLCNQAIKKDIQAYKQLISFIKKYDQEKQTVIMIQIENEVGLLESDRDYSFSANKLYNQEIPLELQKWFKQTGTWQEVFKEKAPEIFMTYYYAQALNQIAASGKEIYPLVTMINVWIKKEGEKPGKYPSGGAISENIELYQYLAPNIDIIAPDIYVKDFNTISQQYAKQGYLMVPETRQDIYSMSQIIYGMSAFPMIGYSPFGIEDFSYNDSMKLYQFLSSLGIERSAFNSQGAKPYLCKIYQDLMSIQSLLLKYRQSEMMHPFIRKEMIKNELLNIGDYQINITYINQDEQINGAGFIINIEDTWYVYGVNFFINISHSINQVGIISLEEGYFENNQWKTTLVLNGDEQYGIYALDEAKFFKVKLHQY